MLVKDVRIGETVQFEHAQYGSFGSMRVEAKTGNVVRLIFDVPRDIIIRAITRASENSYGLRGGERGHHHVQRLQGSAA
jgi:hypothetical protein